MVHVPEYAAIGVLIFRFPAIYPPFCDLQLRIRSSALVYYRVCAFTLHC